MLMHTLELEDRTQLGRALEALLAAEGLSDCAVEIDALRICFHVPEEHAAALIEGIAQGGGLRSAGREWVDLDGSGARARLRRKRR